MYKYVDQKRLGCHAAVKRSAGVAPEDKFLGTCNTYMPLLSVNKAAHSGSRGGVSRSPKQRSSLQILLLEDKLNEQGYRYMGGGSGTLQWWIQDFPEVGARTPGAPTYDFTKFSQKLHEIGPPYIPQYTISLVS